MWALRQSTASQEIPLGPFVDSVDGDTQETALTIANTDIKLFKYGATAEASKNSGGATHIANGRYYATLDATDTDTVGPTRVSCHVAGALAVWLDCCVYTAAWYDANILGTGAAAWSLENFGIIHQGTVQSISASNLIIDAVAAFADNDLAGAVVKIRSATTGAGQSRFITANTGDTVSISPNWNTTPTGTVVVDIFLAPPATTTLPQVNVTQWLTAAAPAMTGDAFARLGAPTGASHAADLVGLAARLPAALTADGNIKADSLYINGVDLEGAGIVSNKMRAA